MIVKINRTNEIITRLRNEGKITFLDSPEHISAIIEMNEQLEEARRDYRIKDKRSQNEASFVVLD